MQSMSGIIPWLPPPLEVVRLLGSLSQPYAGHLCSVGMEKKASRTDTASSHLSLEAV